MIGRLGTGVWEFVVGEDWRVALGVVVTLGATALIAAVGAPAWWIAPIAILAILHRSVRRGVPSASPPPSPAGPGRRSRTANRR
jgi:hypothetical protein